MMDIKNLEQLLAAMNGAKWVPKKILGLPEEGWFLIEIDPTPPDELIIDVTADLEKDEYVAVDNGVVSHSDKCKANVHNLKKQWVKAIEGVRREKYKVALYPGTPGILDGQPIAVVLDPPIDYATYPDHKHLNSARIIKEGILLPDTLCYTDNPAALGEDIDKRIYQAYMFICVWLYRHQLWLASRELPYKEKWIGKQVLNLDNRGYVFAIPPTGMCRCGKKEQYIDCHMPEDYAKFHHISVKDATQYIKANRMKFILEYGEIFAAPKTKARNLLIEHLL